MTTVITIDGTSGVGKGTLARVIAKKLNYTILDSGALYRLVALQTINSKTSISDIKAIKDIALNLPVEFVNQELDNKILLANQDVTEVIRSEEVAAVASQIAAIKQVRNSLLQRQRDFAVGDGLVADGRDMGTKVFPDAKLKIFLTADSKERAKRRVNQLRMQGLSANMRAILKDLELRDQMDISRKNSPLVPAEDSVILDTSNLKFSQVVEKILPLL